MQTTDESLMPLSGELVSGWEEEGERGGEVLVGWTAPEKERNCGLESELYLTPPRHHPPTILPPYDITHLVSYSL